MQRHVLHESRPVTLAGVPQFMKVVHAFGVMRQQVAPDFDRIAQQQFAIITKAKFALEDR
jgi:hypothetical protein